MERSEIILRFKPASQVCSPKTLVRNVFPLFEGDIDSFSVAILEYNSHTAVGVRWNASDKEKLDSKKQSGEIQCKGIPASHGVSTWFLLPESAWFFVYDMIKLEIEHKGVINNIQISLDEIKNKMNEAINEI